MHWETKTFVRLAYCIIHLVSGTKPAISLAYAGIQLQSWGDSIISLPLTDEETGVGPQSPAAKVPSWQGQCWKDLLPALLKPAQPLLGPEPPSPTWRCFGSGGRDCTLRAAGMLMDPFSLISEKL